MKLGICSCKASDEKRHDICREKKKQGPFKLRFLRKEEQQNLTRNFTASSMMTSTHAFRRSFHGSRGDSLGGCSGVFNILLVRRGWGQGRRRPRQAGGVQSLLKIEGGGPHPRRRSGRAHGARSQKVSEHGFVYGSKR